MALFYSVRRLASAALLGVALLAAPAQAAPEVAEVVLVHVDDRRIEHRRRLDDGTWLIREITEGALELAELDICVPLDAIYDLEGVRGPG